MSRSECIPVHTAVVLKGPSRQEQGLTWSNRTEHIGSELEQGKEVTFFIAPKELEIAGVAS